MRAVRTLVVFVVLCSAWAYADTIYTVNMWATFTATQPCSYNCTETIAATFKYEIAPAGYTDLLLVPGSLLVSSSGFLGSFTGGNWIVPNKDYIGLGNGYDEVDIGVPNPLLSTNVPYMTLYSCSSAACRSAYGIPGDVGYPAGLFISPTYQSALVTVPEPGSLAMLLVPVFGFVGWRKWLR